MLCAHVVYGVADIEPFIRKLERHARERVLILSHTASPLAQVSPFWKLVHGEERTELPTLPELLPVLWEMGIFPNVQMFPKTSRRHRMVLNLETLNCANKAYIAQARRCTARTLAWFDKYLS